MSNTVERVEIYKNPTTFIYKDDNFNGEIANGFNNYIIDITKLILSGIGSSPPLKIFDNYKKQLPDQNNVFHLKEKTVLAIINSLKNTDSSGFYNVSYKPVKFIKHLLAAPLTPIINQSLETSILFILTTW